MALAPIVADSEREHVPKRRRLDNGYSSDEHVVAVSPLISPLHDTSERHKSQEQASTRRDSVHGSDRDFMQRVRHKALKAEECSSDVQDSENDQHEPASSPMPPFDPDLPSIDYKPRFILRGHKRAIAAVKFSPDGKWIASCSADATIKIWATANGALQHTLRGHLAGISTIAWSPDSSLLASGSDDKTIRFWNAQTGRPHPYPLLGHNNYIFSLAFSPKGNMLVSGSYDEAVMLWDVRSGRLMKSLPAHSDPVGGVDFVRDGTLVVSCATDGLIRVWDTGTGQCLRTFFHEDTPPVVSVKFSPNGRYILAWMLDNSVRMWNYVDGRCVKTYQGHQNEKYSITGAFGTYGYSEAPTAFIVSGSEDGRVLFWDVVSKRVLQRLDGHRGAVFGIDTHPQLKKIVSCGADRTVRVWDDSTGSIDMFDGNDDSAGNGDADVS